MSSRDAADSRAEDDAPRAADAWSALMAAAQAGDRAAYRALLEAAAPFARALAARALRRPADVEDAVQDILLTLHETRALFDPARPFKPWLAGIARHRIADRQRRLGRAAARETAYDPAVFAAAQAAGRPIVVHIWAGWCPNCAKQTPVLADIAADPANAGLIIFRVDFDSQKDVVRSFGAQMQSTLIVFHGGAERGRSTGDTNAASIQALLARSAM